jgi:hypothetical protein
MRKVLKRITNTAFKYLASTDYELPEDDVETTGGSIIKKSIINCWSVMHLLVHYTNDKDARYKC